MDKKKATKGGAKTKGKKGKKTKKKPDKNLTGDAAAEAKKELVTALMAKCNMSEDQVRNIVKKYFIGLRLFFSFTLYLPGAGAVRCFLPEVPQRGDHPGLDKDKNIHWVTSVLISAAMLQKEFVDQSHAGIIAEALFRVFDEDKSGELSFYEFLQAWNQSSFYIHAEC